MGSQILGVISQYIVIAAVLIGLFLIVRNPDAISKITDSATRLNYTGIMALKAQ
jgi:hypothetical protein